jgi:metal-dependent amidase/aminoacylase/carboxypeptidase family protein
MALKNRFADLHDEITSWRLDFHAHPELRFEEQRTAARVAELSCCRFSGQRVKLT